MAEPTLLSRQAETLEIPRDQRNAFSSEFTRENRGARGQLAALDGTRTLLELSRPEDYVPPPASTGDRT
jgi:hypothetical protein